MGGGCCGFAMRLNWTVGGGDKVTMVCLSGSSGPDPGLALPLMRTPPYGG